ncbi:di-heme oxidoredictase family protein [Halopseudomonas pachastrellae]|nr:di-heme oxidoredictase family protein [Halopseudomonas pachastrellae]
MGPGLADGRGEFLADGNEWRTPPLWGLGLTKTVNPSAGFLHDGRAETVEHAILGTTAKPVPLLTNTACCQSTSAKLCCASLTLSETGIPVYMKATTTLLRLPGWRP